MSEAEELPKISLVVPNYNGGKTIEATLKSIIEQGYPRLELIVMDGKSKDDSVEIIKRYEKHIAYWVSEKDRGQSDAINTGLARATGDVVNWLCSDDLLTPGSLHAVGRRMARGDVDVVIGKCQLVFPDAPERNDIMWPTEAEVPRTPLSNHIPQPSCFYRRELLDRGTAVDEHFFYGMDHELWCYFLSKGARWALIPEILSVAIQDGNNKTRTADYRYYLEADKIFRQYWKGGGHSPTPRWYRMSIRPLAIFVEKDPKRFGAGLARWGIRRMAGLQRRWRKLRSR